MFDLVLIFIVAVSAAAVGYSAGVARTDIYWRTLMRDAGINASDLEE